MLSTNIPNNNIFRHFSLKKCVYDTIYIIAVSNPVLILFYDRRIGEAFTFCKVDFYCTEQTKLILFLFTSCFRNVFKFQDIIEKYLESGRYPVHYLLILRYIWNAVSFFIRKLRCLPEITLKRKLNKICFNNVFFFF